MKGEKNKITMESGEVKDNVSGKVDPSIKKALQQKAKKTERNISYHLQIALYEYLTR
jgi:predicted transcriptional regulator